MTERFHFQSTLLDGVVVVEHRPIVDEARLVETRPEYVLILPWNLRDEVIRQLEYVRAWGGRFVTAVPRLQLW